MHIGHPDTQAFIASQEKLKADFIYKEFTDWHDPLSSTDDVKEDDIFIFVSAHQGYISHLPVLDKMPTRIERRFPDVSRIVIFPKRYTDITFSESSEFIVVS